jgi:glycerol-1-phosphate dehydrogenase [NAD(P)+]
MIEGQTNVRSAVFGAGSIDGLGRSLDRFVVTTMPVPWQLVKDRLGGDPAGVVFVDSMEVEELERQLAGLAGCDACVGIGGGRAVDAAKYFAWRRGTRLVTIPTALSVDAFVTPAAGVRRSRKVEYMGESSPDPLVIDFDLIRTAPRELNIAGIGDLLSIHTATFDWELAAGAGRSEYPFVTADVRNAREILDDILSRAEGIRSCSDDGLRAIVEGYMRVNAICLPAGHYRVEEGSEHYLFYELEERLGRAFVHGQIVGLGVYLMSRLQENDPETVTRFMDHVGLPYHTADLAIDRVGLEASLRSLAGYVERRRDFWYTVINERPITDRWLDAALAGLRFASC